MFHGGSRTDSGSYLAYYHDDFMLILHARENTVAKKRASTKTAEA